MRIHKKVQQGQMPITDVVKTVCHDKHANICRAIYGSKHAFLCRFFPFPLPFWGMGIIFKICDFSPKVEADETFSKSAILAQKLRLNDESPGKSSSV